jgi:Ca2+-transporting ATPase
MIPIQILFVNLVTDGLPALALGVDPPDPAVMERPPRPPGESVFARGLGGRIALRGALIGVMTLLVFAYGLGPAGMGLRGARTIALATLIMSQLFHVFDARSEDRNFLEVGLFSNPWAILAVLSSIVMLLGIIYWPPLARLFYTVRLDPADWLVVVAASGGIQLFSTVRYLMGRERVTAPIPAGDG